VIRRVLDDLERHGAIKHAFLGVVVGDVQGERAVQITTVVRDSPAAAAGLTAGQRIEAIDDLACPSAALFARVLVLHRPGDEVTLVTGGKEMKVRLGERAAEPANVATAEGLGLTCVELGAELRRFLGVDADLRGVAVQAVKEGSPAANAGIRRGDVITGGGGGAISDLEELKAALAGAKGTIELSGTRATGAWTATVKY
jgi:S1-C subfamily serine protease